MLVCGFWCTANIRPELDGSVPTNYREAITSRRSLIKIPARTQSEINMSDYRQQQEQDEHQQWLADSDAQKEYQIWLGSQEAGRRAAYEMRLFKEIQNVFNRK